MHHAPMKATGTVVIGHSNAPYPSSLDTLYLSNTIGFNQITFRYVDFRLLAK